MGPKVRVQRNDLSAPLPAAQAPGPRILPPWQEDFPASLGKGRQLVKVSKIDQLSVWRLNHFDKTQAIYAASSCSTDRSVSFCSMCASLM